ncbi:MAG: GMP reductase [Ignisphaera sp.]|nr:GMP reductase [Ignisphaera sp.]
MTRIIDDPKYDFKDVLILPKRSSLSSRSEVSLEKEYTFMNSGRKYKGIPVIGSNMDGVGNFEMAAKMASAGLFTTLVKHYTLEELVAFYNDCGPWAINHTAYSMGISKDDLDKFNKFKKVSYVKFLCVDVANGYQQSFVDFIAKLRDNNPEHIIIAGNVVSPEITEALLFAGADVVKVGIGPGSACSTRIKTGIGYPQLSAIIECADAAHGLGGHIISDGGCSCPGDVAKAFAANADFVMLGGMLAGHEEGGQVKSDRQGNKTVEFYGMSSQKAQEAHNSSLKDYRASEGRVLHIPYRGEVLNTIQDILGGLRSACTYTGSKSLKELPKRATFVKVHQQFNAAYGVGEI